MEAPPLVRALQFRYNLVQKVFRHVSLWYTIYKSNEQCETGQEKIFVVFAHKRIFSWPVS